MVPFWYGDIYFTKVRDFNLGIITWFTSNYNRYTHHMFINSNSIEIKTTCIKSCWHSNKMYQQNRLHAILLHFTLEVRVCSAFEFVFCSMDIWDSKSSLVSFFHYIYIYIYTFFSRNTSHNSTRFVTKHPYV